ncbi:MAG: hypothetical protein D6722_02970 [Bacteroidetes bacterium]|nr:MAG: hypothetical protein D6722_02970 [Bacteroidota bacterium]
MRAYRSGQTCGSFGPVQAFSTGYYTALAFGGQAQIQARFLAGGALRLERDHPAPWRGQIRLLGIDGAQLGQIRIDFPPGRQVWTWALGDLPAGPYLLQIPGHGVFRLWRD